MTTTPLDTRPADALTLGRCVDCQRALRGAAKCDACGRSYEPAGGIMPALGLLTGLNRISAAFYDGPQWARFRPWERLFLWFQGPGQAQARRKVLRHLPASPGPRVLEVGIGDGENLALLPQSWDVYGVDIAPSLLDACRARFPSTSGRLALAEGERLPFDDGVFDAVYTIGGINYFSDPALTLREMARVARPGATLLAADERSDLYRLAPGHALGLDGLDAWGLRVMGLDREFVRMVLETPARVEPAARAEWPGHRKVPIWNRLGYCLVHVREA